MKIAIIGAGSVSFCPITISDIALSKEINKGDVELYLMDIDKSALSISYDFAKEIIAHHNRNNIKLKHSTDLEEAVKDANFVITAIEVERYYYWAQDFHIPKKYGFRQVYGENGGPGGMFHFLRNLGPMLDIARAMEKNCPNAYLLNYTNPEAKLVQAIAKLTNIKVVGICHGFEMGKAQILEILKREDGELDIEGYGLNHFGLITKIIDKKTKEDLYPLLKKREEEGNWLSKWDEIGLSRIMLRTYGFWPYPGTNHIGEYFSWADSFLASEKINFFYDPVKESIRDENNKLQFIYDFTSNPTNKEFDHKEVDIQHYQNSFQVTEKYDKFSGEYGVPIIEAIISNKETIIPSLNTLNNGSIPNLDDNICVEGPTRVTQEGFKIQKQKELPKAFATMINSQGAITDLLIQAYEEKSKTVLLQAVLLDPTVSTYNNAVYMIEEFFDVQKKLLPSMDW